MDDERDDFAVWVRAGASAPRVNLASCGDGIGQVLPILTLLLLTPRAARPGLLCLEQPDLHLHPRAHAELGDLLIHCTNHDPDLRLLVECHSDVLLLRLRRRVAEGLDPNRIGVLYVDQADDGASTLREIQLNTRGVPDWWPSGVFEEAPQEYLAMRRHLSRHVL